MATEGTTWICMDCGARNPSSGSCSACGQGPLLDARDPQVRSALALQDGERLRKRSRLLMGVAAGIAAVVGFPLVFLLGQFVGLVAVVSLGAGVYAVLRLAFPYRSRIADL
jgi:hypothetical protein